MDDRTLLNLAFDLAHRAGAVILGVTVTPAVVNITTDAARGYGVPTQLWDASLLSKSGAKAGQKQFNRIANRVYTF